MVQEGTECEEDEQAEANKVFRLIKAHCFA